MREAIGRRYKSVFFPLQGPGAKQRVHAGSKVIASPFLSIIPTLQLNAPTKVDQCEGVKPRDRSCVTAHLRHDVGQVSHEDHDGNLPVRGVLAQVQALDRVCTEQADLRKHSI